MGSLSSFYGGVLKNCVKCGHSKELDDFHRTSISADGRVNTCKECKRVYDRNRHSAIRDGEMVYVNRPVVGAAEKVCCRCGVKKIASEFYKRSKARDGLCSHCIDCAKLAKKAYYAANSERIKREVKRYYRDHKDERRDYSKKYYAENSDRLLADGFDYRNKNRDRINARARLYRAENSDKVRERNAKYRNANREKRREAYRRWRADNREIANAASKRWRESNREKVLESARICGARRRARKLAATTVDFSYDHVMARWAYYGNRCYLCKRDAEQTDHVKPLAKGGANMLCNLRPICRKCNEFKNDRWPYLNLLPVRG